MAFFPRLDRLLRKQYADKLIDGRERLGDPQTLGQAISNARKKQGMSQKELAAKIKREDGMPISPQYLNDIEHDRRSPSSDHMIRQFAEVLGLKPEYLHYLAGKLPEDRRRDLSEDEATQAMMAFRGGPIKTRRGR